MSDMNDAAVFFKEEWNKEIFRKNDLMNQIRIIDKELSELDKREKNINTIENSPEYVFRADCINENEDDKERAFINSRREALINEKETINDRIAGCDIRILKFDALYNSVADLERNKLEETFLGRLKFVLELMDTDIQRAKLELADLLKEGDSNAD